MPEIKPFRAIMFNSQRVKIPEVVAPPYDVISKDRCRDLYELSPYNVVRLILGREEDPYASAARSYAQWMAEGILSQEAEPALYLLSQHFTASGERGVERRGFIAACRLEEFGSGSVYPHEQTHAGPKEDRLRLFEATGAMFSQIFALYPDPKHVLDRQLDAETQRLPDVDVEFDGIRNRLWKILDGSAILALAGFLKGQRVLVADGHHRYETALSYSNARRFKNPRHTGTEPYNFVPVYFTNMNDSGLVILPTHRIVHGMPRFRRRRFLDALADSFEIRFEESPDDLVRSLAARTQGAFGLVLPDDPGFVLLSYKRRTVPGAGDVPALLAHLDLTILHSVIMKKMFHTSEEEEEKKFHIEYEHDTRQAVRTVREGKAQAAFLLNPPRIELLRAIAEGGFTMPRKSTYFFPKLLSGLVMYSFAGG